MTLARTEHTADKYIHCIKDAHLAMVSNPLIILRMLIAQYLASSPQDFSFFNFQDHAKQDMRNLYRKLENFSELDLVTVMNVAEESLSVHQTPLSSELEAMWVAFYKYYFRMLTVPTAGSLFEPILQRAKNHSIMERFFLLDAQMTKVLESPATLDVGEVRAALLAVKFYKNINNSLTKESFFQTLDLLCRGRSQNYSESLVDLSFNTYNSFEIWASSIAYVVGQLKSNKDKINLKGIIRYLFNVIIVLDKNKISIALEVQQDLIDILFDRFDPYANNFDNFVIALTQLDIIDIKIKAQVYNQVKKLVLAMSSKDIKLYVGYIRLLLALKEKQDNILCALLIEIFPKIKKEDNWIRLMFLKELYGILEDDLLKKYQNLNKYREVLLKNYFALVTLPYALTWPTIEFLQKITIDPKSQAKFVTVLNKQRHPLPVICAIFAMYKRRIPTVHHDMVWEKVFSTLNSFSFSGRLWSQYEEYFFNCINEQVIPPLYHPKVVLALKFSLFTQMTINSQCYLFTANWLISILSEDDQQALFLELKEMLGSADSRQREVAISLLAEYSQVNPLWKNEIFEYALRTPAKDAYNFLYDLRPSLIKLASSCEQKNKLFMFAYQALQESDDNLFVMGKEILEEMPLSGAQRLILVEFIFRDLSQNKDKHAELYEQLDFMQKISIPNDWCGRFINLLLSMQNLAFKAGHVCFYFTVIIDLAEQASLSINMELNQAVELFDSFCKGIYYQDDLFILLKFVSILPIDVQIGLMTHAEKLPYGWNALVKESIQVRLELEDSHRELPLDLWREVHKKISLKKET